MKALSIILTVLLILPITAICISSWLIVSKESYGNSHMILWQMLSPILVYLLFIFTAITLNIMGKFKENCLICGTILVSFFLFQGLNLIVAFMLNAQWLK